MVASLRNIFFDGLFNHVVDSPIKAITGMVYREEVSWAWDDFDFAGGAGTPAALIDWPHPAMIFRRLVGSVEIPPGGMYRFEGQGYQLVRDKTARGIFIGSEDCSDGYLIEGNWSSFPYDFNHKVYKATGGSLTLICDGPSQWDLNGSKIHLIYLNLDSVPHSIEAGAEILAPGDISFWKADDYPGHDTSFVHVYTVTATGIVKTNLSSCVFGKYIRNVAGTTNLFGTVVHNFGRDLVQRSTSRIWLPPTDAFDTELGSYTTLLGDNLTFHTVNAPRTAMGWDQCPIYFEELEDIIDPAYGGGFFRFVVQFASTVPIHTTDDTAYGVFLTSGSNRQNGYILEIQRTVGPIYTIKVYRVVAGVLTEIGSSAIANPYNRTSLIVYWNKTSITRPTQDTILGSTNVPMSNIAFLFCNTDSGRIVDSFTETLVYQEDSSTVLTGFPINRIGYYQRSLAPGANISQNCSAVEVILTQDVAPLLPPANLSTTVLQDLFVVAKDVIMVILSNNVINNKFLNNASNYTITNLSGGVAGVVDRVLPAYGRSVNSFFLHVKMLQLGQTYKLTIKDRSIFDSSGLPVPQAEITWLMHRTKVDMTIRTLADLYNKEVGSVIRSLVEAMMISDEKIGGDF